MNNGDGLRVVLWLSGCSHHCYNCQNPQTWNPDSGIPFDESAKQEIFDELSKDYISGITLSGGDPLYEQNLDEVLNLIEEIREKYPISQNVDLENPYKSSVLEHQNGNEFRLSFPEKTIWLYSGFTWQECQPFSEEGVLKPDNFAPNLQAILKKRWEIISLCDVFIDGRYIDEQRNLSKKWAGSDNQRVIDVKQSLAQNKIVLYCD